jgi:hypothetical protein
VTGATDDFLKAQGRAVAVNRRESDLPFKFGDRVVERIGSGDGARVGVAKVVSAGAGICMVEPSGNWYSVEHGGRFPANEGPYRAIHSMGYSGAQ